MRCFHRTTLNPRGIELEKPDQCFIVETANQIISKVKSFIQNFDIDVFGVQVSGTFEMHMGGSMKGGVVYIEDNGINLLGSIHGGASLTPNLSGAVEIFVGSHPEIDKNPTQENVKGNSFSFSIPIMTIFGGLISYGYSEDYDPKTKKLGDNLIMHSLIFSGELNAFKKLKALSAITKIADLKKKYIAKMLLEADVSCDRIGLWKIPIPDFLEDNDEKDETNERDD